MSGSQRELVGLEVPVSMSVGLIEVLGKVIVLCTIDMRHSSR